MTVLATSQKHGSEPSTAQITLSYFADSGEYYDSVDNIPDDILVRRIHAAERIMSSPDKFPKANIQAVETAWPSLCAIAAGRLLFLD